MKRLPVPLILAVFGIASCRKAKPRATPLRPPPIARGDRVVVERAAADFFEARVLSVSDSTLKVQTAEDGEPVVVARSDAYLLPPPPHGFSRGNAAICNAGSTRWAPCRIERAVDGGFAVIGVAGEDRILTQGQIIAPRPVTELDIRRALDATIRRRSFTERAARAGEPQRPSGWRPSPHEPILGRRASGWFSAHVVRGLSDGGVEVSFEAIEHPEAVPGSSIVPAPPFDHRFVGGDFALLRSGSAGEAWERVQVEAVGPDEAVVVRGDGSRRHVSVRAMVPLAPSAPF